MEKNTNLKRDGRHEKVVLEKTADRVGISGPYTKRELRKLLLSSISLLRPYDDDTTELDSIIKKKTGLSQVDLDKIKEGKIDEISEDADRTLKDFNVTKDEIESARKKKEDDLEKKKKKSFKNLLKDRGLSDGLIKSLMQNGLTDEYVRLLKALGFTDIEIERLRMSWQSEMYDSTSLSDSEKSSASLVSSSDDNLTPEGIYLKNFLSQVLARALCDIVSKKPYDPVEYLGHWLLHLKICEEREKRRKEFEMELMIERERYRIINMEDEEILEIESGGQECDEDWISGFEF